MRYDNIIPFTYQRYVIKIPSINVRYTNKATTNTVSELYTFISVEYLSDRVKHEKLLKCFLQKFTLDKKSGSDQTPPIAASDQSMFFLSLHKPVFPDDVSYTEHKLMFLFNVVV